MEFETLGPLVSVVLPTRDRPNYIKFALESLRLQTFRDFEVIVCDNHTGQDCKAVFDTFADDRFRYVVPKHPLSMHENWEYATSLAQGQYVSILVDKTVLRPTAFEELHRAIKSHPADAYSWLNDGFVLTREDAGEVGPGYFVPMWKTNASPEYIDVNAEITRRLSFDIRRGREGRRYYWGKICFGAYSSALLSRIKQETRNVFPPISPDYTSMAAALRLSDNVVDIRKPLMVSLVTKVSNGMIGAADAAWAKKFLKQADPQLRLLEDFPIPGLYISHHNTVGYDYRRFFVAEDSPRDYVRHINLQNLKNRALEDFWRVRYWPSLEEKSQQLDHIAAISKELSRNDLTYMRLALSKAVMTWMSKDQLVSLARDVAHRALIRKPRLYDQAIQMIAKRHEKQHKSFKRVIDAITLDT